MSLEACTIDDIECKDELEIELPKAPYHKKNPKTGKKSLKRRNWEERTILDMHVKNISAELIAKAVELPENTIKRKLIEWDHIFSELPKVDSYRELKSQLLCAAEIATLQSALVPEKLAESSTLNSAKAFDIFHKAGRLENNQSTENVAVQFGRMRVPPKGRDE